MSRESTRQASRCWRHCSANCAAAPAFWCRSMPSTWTSCRAHLRVTFAVESADGTEVARGKDLEALQEQLAAPGPPGRRRRRRRRAGTDRAARLARRAGPSCRASSNARSADAPCAASRLSSTPAARSICGCSPLRSSSDAAMGPGTRRLLRLGAAVAGQSGWSGNWIRVRAWCSARIRTDRWPRCSRTAPTRRSTCWRPSRSGPRAEFAALRDRVAADAAVDDHRHRGPRRKGAGRRARRGTRAAGPAATRAGRRDRRRPRAAGPAAAARVRHRHRTRASRRSGPLPDRDRPPPGPAAPRRRGRPASGCSGCTPFRDAYDELVQRAAADPTARPPTSATSPGRSRSCGSACGPSSWAPPARSASSGSIARSTQPRAPDET